MHTTSPHFIQLCRLLVHQMEQIDEDLWDERREDILDALMQDLMKEGLVFDRAFAGQLFDQLAVEDLPVAERYEASRIDALRNKIREDHYFSEGLMKTLGDRILWVMGSH